MAVNKKMIDCRKKSGLRIQYIVDYLGCKRGALYAYERGLRQPKFETMVKLAKLYGCTVDDFING